MTGPTDDLAAAVAAQVESLLSSQRQNTAGVVAGAMADAREDSQREGRGSTRVVYGGIGGMVMAMATITGWAMDKAEEWDQYGKSQVQILQKLDAVLVKQKTLEGHQIQIGRRMIGTEMALADGFDWLSDKIDAKNSRMSRKFKRPDTLDAAKTRADEIRRQTKLDDLFGHQPLDAFVSHGSHE